LKKNQKDLKGIAKIKKMKEDMEKKTMQDLKGQQMKGKNLKKSSLKIRDLNYWH
jgi:hypothetical protein